MVDKGENAIWESFKVRSMEEYFPNSVWYAKEWIHATGTGKSFSYWNMLLGSNI